MDNYMTLNVPSPLNDQLNRLILPVGYDRTEFGVQDPHCLMPSKNREPPVEIQELYKLELYMGYG